MPSVPLLTVRSLREIEAYDAPLGDLILENGYLVKGERTSMLGQGGLGKSRLSLQLAMCCRAGVDFLGWSTSGQELRWLFLQTENGNRRLQYDLQKMRGGFSKDAWPDIQDGVFMHTLEGEVDGILLLDRKEHFDRASDAIERCAADVVVVDPLRDLHSGSLNDDSEMNEACRNIALLMRAGGRTDRACIVLHHARTGSAGISKSTGYDRADFGRNSKVLHGWTRAQINLAPGSPDDCELLVVASGKNNNFQEFAPLAIRLDPDLMLYYPDPSFDLETWKEGVEGAKRTSQVTEEQIREAIKAAEGKIEKKDLVTKLRQQTGLGQRKVEDAVKSHLGGLIWEVKEPRSGKRDAVFIALKP